MPLAELAAVVRSGFTEGVHVGSAVALAADGTVVLAAGEPEAPVFPRSSNKPLQLVAMLRAGLDLPADPAAAHLVALATASHSGEAYHLDGARRILAAAGLTEADLANTPDLPLGTQERVTWQRLGLAPSSIAQNCSGKHAAMLATCVRNGWDTATYLDPEHPLQQAIGATVAELAGEVAAVGTDGCGAPVHAVSLTGLARAFAHLATAKEDTPEHRVAEAVRRHPEWLGGTGRDVTALIRAVPGLVAKDGAEGVYAAALPDGRAVAVKVSDGAERARPVVMAALLRRLGVGTADLAAFAASPVLGHGRPVGAVQALV